MEMRFRALLESGSPGSWKEPALRPRARSALVALLLAPALASCATFGARDAGIERSVVRIVNNAQRADWYTPWEASAPELGAGSGFVIEGGLVMTNAHVVSDARMVLLFLYGDPTPHEARVRVIGHDCDLALVEPVEAGVLEGLPAMSFDGLPELRSVVETYGYPAGGERISSTRGVVSRIEMQRYSHTEGDSHLTVQTDAAINPGNSGGPVVQGGKVVGVAFQAATLLENVGYFIPTEVISHFLTDAADGRYDGYPDLGISTSNLENPAAQRRAGMRPGESGVRVDFVFRGSSADGRLRPGDVLLEIESHPLANDGTVAAEGGLRLDFEVLLDRLQIGDELSLRVLREGQRQELRFPVDRYAPFRLYRRIYDEAPRYFVYAGLVFVPLDREVLLTEGEEIPPQLIYESYLRPIAEPDSSREEPVLLLRRLDHPVNADMTWSRDLVVDRVDGRPIRDLRELAAALEADAGPFHVIEFAYSHRFAVIDREQAERSNAEILERYGVPRDRRL
jgi:S1-C subfamily serine protease